MTPTPEQLSKLPKWAQDHIKDITRERETAVRTLNRFVDEDTPSPFYIEEAVSTGERCGPSMKRRYIQAYSMSVVWSGVHLTVAAHDYGSRGDGIKLSWGGNKNRTSDIAFIPDSYQSARLVTPDQMRK